MCPQHAHGHCYQWTMARAHLHNPAHTYYQARPVITIAPSLVTRHWCRVPSVHGIYYPVLAWSIQLLAYAMPSVPAPPIILLTDMVTRCRLLAAHGARSCLSVRTQPLTATGAPSQTSTIPYHTIPCNSASRLSPHCRDVRPITASLRGTGS